MQKEDGHCGEPEIPSKQFQSEENAGRYHGCWHFQLSLQSHRKGHHERQEGFCLRMVILGHSGL